MTDPINTTLTPSDKDDILEYARQITMACSLLIRITKRKNPPREDITAPLSAIAKAHDKLLELV